jgi:hypothetical protein
VLGLGEEPGPGRSPGGPGAGIWELGDWGIRTSGWEDLHIDKAWHRRPGAGIWGLGDWGIRTSGWEDLHIVKAWQEFLADPGLYFRHLLSE